MAATVCKWETWPKLEKSLYQFIAKISKTSLALTSIEPSAKELSSVLDFSKRFEGSGDPQLDILITLANAKAYQAFGQYLKRAAAANKAVTAVLDSKAQESLQSAQKAQARCGKILQASSVLTPAAKACSRPSLPSLKQALTWSHPIHLRTPGSDNHSKDVLDIEKQIFANRQNWKLYFDIGQKYLNGRQWSFAAATAVYGSSTFAQNKEEFNAILGCAVLRMGFVNEAQFHLSKASDIGGLKQGCLSRAQREVRSQ
jgi:hypothetical protein